LLDPETNRHFRTAARSHFTATYSARAVMPQLAASYQRAVSAQSRSERLREVVMEAHR
jgi:hypothetical protein